MTEHLMAKLDLRISTVEGKKYAEVMGMTFYSISRQTLDFR